MNPMSLSEGRRAGRDFDLLLPLLGVAILELAFNRLAVPVLRPHGNQVVPAWHHGLDLVSLFLFHLATVLSAAVCAWEALWLALDRGLPRMTRLLAPTGLALFIGLAAWAAISTDAPQGLSFHLESAFTLVLMIVGLVMTLARSPGTTRIKLGYVALVLPFLIHYYGTFALRLTGSPAGPLADQLQVAGQWSVTASAILVSLCFAPRPLHRALFRPAPLVIGGFVGAITLVLFVRHQEVGMELASRGLGIVVDPGAPMSVLVANVVAASAVAWMLTGAFTSTRPSEQLSGVGFALVVVGGYAYAWPLQLLTVVTGALAVMRAVTDAESPA
jgi:hypothetical protein